GEVCAPPSKSYTQRMLVASSLSTGSSIVRCPLVSDDTAATLRAIRALGAEVDIAKGCWKVEGANPIKGAKEPIDCGDSGATLRFMIPVAALATETSAFLVGDSLKDRPVEPLLQSLRQLGAETSTEKVGDKPGIKVQGGGLIGGKTSIRGDVSSQFISGLMFACPLAQNDTEITLTTPLESKGYVKMTREILSKHGVEVCFSRNFRRICIPSNQTYKVSDHWVPGDFSSAAFLFGAAAITCSDVTITNLDFSLFQGDEAIIEVLKRMGVRRKLYRNQIEIEGTGNLLGAIEVNAKDTPDLVPIFAALACYAKGTSRIKNAGRLRLKESDRLSSLQTELSKMGADISASEDNLTVNGPSKLHGADIDPHKDHRIAMACAVAALGAEGETRIHDAECVKKSYPRFFTDLDKLGVNVVGGKFNR
ncbi:MAG TPA: 3-phosphoshikimate 1-carboxyvinyltransferase, partial [Candidatus Bathyarchaeia archaeon]